MTDHDALVDRLDAWVAVDPDPHTRTQAMALRDGDLATLAEHFGDRLVFGTAGLRGPLGPGPTRMNRLQVRQVSQALADVILAQTPGPHVAVVGFDARHGSARFARDTAEVLATAGLRVHLFDRVCPTPELAHAQKHLGAQVAVMVTASHNPPADNGYKVYGPWGGQIIAPWDAWIAAAIDGEINPETPDLDTLRDRGQVVDVPEDARRAYVDGVLALRVHPVPGHIVRIVYTAMHGVASELLHHVFGRAGHHDLHAVPSQCTPDPDFPTVRFPNPEEPGALDEAMRLATELGADLILANDPDGDRLAVAIGDGDGGYRQLTGNEVGVLLADDLLGGRAGEDRLVATTVVSTSMLARIAEAHGAGYAETLTGFKWLADLAVRHEGEGGTFVLGFEEALGYCAGTVVHDKDGISAALLLADLASHLATRGLTLADRLEQLAAFHGLHVTHQHALTLRGTEGRARIEAAMAALRARAIPGMALGGVDVLQVRDFDAGITRSLVDSTEQPLDMPRSNVLAFALADGARVLARPSGTEPKLKLYFEVRVALAELTADQARAEAARRIEALREQVLSAAGLAS